MSFYIQTVNITFHGGKRNILEQKIYHFFFLPGKELGEPFYRSRFSLEILVKKTSRTEHT